MTRAATVGVRELKTRLGGYLQQVRQGRTLIVTDRGEPVAELRPLPGLGAADERLERLKSVGAVTRLKSRQLTKLRPVRGRGKSVADAIIEASKGAPSPLAA